MKFGKEFRIHLEETLPEWRDKFLCYKPLKKLLKNFPTAAAVDSTLPPVANLQDWFVRILREELEKFNDFYVDKEEEFVIRLQDSTAEMDKHLGLGKRLSLWALGAGTLEELKERIERLKEKSHRNGDFTSEAEFSEEMMDIRKDFVTIHGEMVLLKNYSSLNFAGLVKILKKYDKRTGGLLQMPFTQLVVDQPFFTTEPLTRLVHECEANLELLFPVEAEVVQSSSKEPGTTSQQEAKKNETAANPPENALPAPPLGEETTEVYRSTLAAIRTIQGLRKESSTHNPLSFASLFGKQDSESTGALTAENSPSDSLTSSEKEEDPEIDDAGSPK